MKLGIAGALAACVACGRIEFADVPLRDGGDDARGDGDGGDGGRDDGAVPEPSCPTGGCVVAHGFSRRFGSPSVDYSFDVVAHGTDRFSITGFFTGSIDFGGGALPSSGSHEIMVVTYDLDGAHIASRSFGGPTLDEGFGLRVAPNGDYYIVGRGSTGVNFGGGALTSNGNFDAVFARVASDGTHVWSKIGGAASDDVASDVVIDATGASYTTGQFTQSIDLGAGMVTGPGGAEGFVVVYEASGAYRWSRLFMSTGNDRGASIGFDATTNTVYVSGDFGGTLDFGKGQVTSAGSSDGYVVALDATTGATRWVVTWGGTLVDGCNGIVVDAAGGVYVGAFFSDTMTFNGMQRTSAGGSDILLFKIEPDGTIVWVSQHGGTSNERPIRLAVGPFGEIVAGGTFAGTGTFGGTVLTAAGNTDAVLFSVTAQSGTSLWGRGFGSVNQDEVQGVAIDRLGRVFAVGAFSNTIDVGGGPLTSAGGLDMFLIRLDPQLVLP